MTQEELSSMAPQEAFTVALQSNVFKIEDLSCDSQLESLLTNAWLAGAQFILKSLENGDSGPVSSGTPCTLDTDNHNKAIPL